MGVLTSEDLRRIEDMSRVVIESWPRQKQAALFGMLGAEVPAGLGSKDDPAGTPQRQDSALDRFDDPTPLAETTDEQWRELGFVESDPRYKFSHCWSRGACVYLVKDAQLFFNEKKLENTTTRGQLLALLFAIGEAV